MTTSLLVVREYIRNFYVKYEEYVVPGLKFLLALVSLLLINGQLGYMSQINGMAVVLITSLICSFMPKNFTLFAAAGFVTLHLYEVSLECAGVALVVFLLLFLLYFRFTPKGGVLVMITPLLFVLRIPYAAPIVAGLLGVPLSAVTVVCGVVVYYLIHYMSMNASLLSSAAADSMLPRIREILDAILRFLPLDSYVEHPTILMEVMDGDPYVPEIWEEYRQIAAKYEPDGAREEAIDRFAFYERARKAYAVVTTGETALYANIILKKGVVKE